MSDELTNFTSGTDQSPAEPTGNEEPKKKRGRKKAEGAEVAEGGEKKSRREKKVKEPKPKRDNIAAVNALNSIQGIRKFLQIAIAKKAKSAGREEAIARYEAEIEAAKTRLAELIEIASTDANPIAKFLELDEELNKVITHFIDAKEANFKAWLEAHDYKVSRAAMKNINEEIPEAFFAELPMDLHEVLVKRFNKSDFRLQAVCKQANFVVEVEAGNLIYENNKWKVPGAQAAADAQ